MCFTTKQLLQTSLHQLTNKIKLFNLLHNILYRTRSRFTVLFKFTQFKLRKIIKKRSSEWITQREKGLNIAWRATHLRVTIPRTNKRTKASASCAKGQTKPPASRARLCTRVKWSFTRSACTPSTMDENYSRCLRRLLVISSQPPPTPARY